ncbi:MAG: hypothetical protein ABIX37_08970 [Gammaproteobacteria bacterium]
MSPQPTSRLRLQGEVHHITLRGRDGQALFLAPADRATLDGLVGDVLRTFRARAHAYCWMTNHLHLVAEVAPARANPLAIELADRYSAAWSGEAAARSPLFALPQPPFRVHADAYLLQLIRYVHLNPVRGGLARDAADYPWSGHRTYLGYGGPAWLSTDLGLRLLGGDLLRAVAAYRVFVAPIGTPHHREALVDCRFYPGRY